MLQLLHTPLPLFQASFDKWAELPRELADVLPAAARNQSRPLLLGLVWELRRALGSRLHRVQWLHDLLLAMLEVRSADTLSGMQAPRRPHSFVPSPTLWCAAGQQSRSAWRACSTSTAASLFPKKVAAPPPAGPSALPRHFCAPSPGILDPPQKPNTPVGSAHVELLSRCRRTGAVPRAPSRGCEADGVTPLSSRPAPAAPPADS